MPAPLPITSTPLFLEALGLHDDPVTAKQFGVAVGTVKYHRDKYGIPSWRSVRRHRVKRLIRKGALNDSEIQALTGMDRRAIARLRAKMGSVSPYVLQAQANAEKLLAYMEATPDTSVPAAAKAVGLSTTGAYHILSKLD